MGVYARIFTSKIEQFQSTLFGDDNFFIVYRAQKKPFNQNYELVESFTKLLEGHFSLACKELVSFAVIFWLRIKLHFNCVSTVCFVI